MEARDTYKLFTERRMNKFEKFKYFVSKAN